MLLVATLKPGGTAHQNNKVFHSFSLVYLSILK